ncbi:hypothetical protein [Ornithinibacillus halophilus]|uniref:Similar to spore coat protein n=1 Tax=Ornithinibacillus halophilus TaxID=930117 RepID=A0A1M5F589_9BACI|nr:hypothetical protein [Ornithinibacillus halophilus]SHF86252.1 similar to spore coat protein [Ornithinibacillus halophilus]
MQDNLGVHESLELQEIMSFKSLCLTKASVMKALVTDETLKGLMEQDAMMHTRHLEELKSHLN